MARLAPRFLALLALLSAAAAGCLRPQRVVPCPPCAEPPPPAGGIDGLKDRVVEHLNAGDVDALFALFGPAMKEAVPREKLQPFAGSILAAGGRIRSSAPLSVGPRAGSYLLQAERAEWQLELAATADGEIAALQISPRPGAADPPVASSALPLGLPFRGSWFVAWGGDTAELNQHLQQPSQRRAADLVVLDERGRSFRTDGRRNEDYYAWGQEILAVADGRVVTAIDGVPENEPGSVNPFLATGNMVIVEHLPRLYSVYAHLQPGLPVKAGARVRRGQVLGRCGNSGHSSEPHLHFQLQDGPRFERSWGVEAVFGEVLVTRGALVTRESSYSFRKGDRVAGAERPAR